MNFKRIVILVTCLLLAAVISGHDHFKVYQAKSTMFKGTEVKLRDQFDPNGSLYKVTSLAKFANPVSKNYSKIVDPNAHLTWYTIEFVKGMPPVKRVVYVENQFGQQKFILGKARFLLLPTLKVKPGHVFPAKLDHFKCYEILEAEFKPRSVKLKDQFSRAVVPADVMKPVFFCNPVAKNRGIIKDKTYHLTCYYMQPKEEVVKRTVSIKNQFGADKLYVYKSDILCVPTKKLKFEVLK